MTTLKYPTALSGVTQPLVAPCQLATRAPSPPPPFLYDLWFGGCSYSYIAGGRDYKPLVIVLNRAKFKTINREIIGNSSRDLAYCEGILIKFLTTNSCVKLFLFSILLFIQLPGTVLYIFYFIVILLGSPRLVGPPLLLYYFFMRLITQYAQRFFSSCHN